MKNGEKRWWFPAKRYGWGWGFPSAWQGWVVLFGFLAAMTFISFVFPPDDRLGLFLGGVIGCSVVLVAICFAKGERPRWRWGESDQSDREKPD